MTWNHRVMCSVDSDGSAIYSIREVFYNEDGSITGWTAEPMDPFGETLDELRSDLERMTKALDDPILDEAELEKEIAARPTNDDATL